MCSELILSSFSIANIQGKLVPDDGFEDELCSFLVYGMNSEVVHPVL